MSADSNNNNLEDFFRNSLNNFSTEPSSQLWDRIAAGIPEKPARKISLVYLLLAALILLLISALVIQYFSFNQQMKDMAQKVESQDEQMVDLQKEFENKINQLSNQLGVHLKAQPENPQQTPHKTTLTVNQHPVNGAIKTKDVEQNSVSDPPEEQQNIIASGQTEGDDHPVMPELSPDGPNGKQSTIDQETQTDGQKATGSLDDMASQPVFAEPQYDFQVEAVKLPRQKSSSTSIEIYTAAQRTIPKVNLSPSSNDFNAFYSKSLGALLSFELNNRWDIQLGLGYSKTRINNSVTKELYYENEEIDATGEVFSSRYSYTVRTNYGDLLISSLLVNEKENDGEDIKDGDPFLLNVKFQEEIQYINLPVFVRYKIGNNRLRYSVKGGIIQKFLYNERTQLSEVEASTERLMNSESIIEEDLGTIRQSGTDALLGVGLEYQLTKRNSINVETVFVQSLNEIYQDIQPFSIGIQLGLQHRLGK